MADFEAITSQEQLDSIIKDRINRLNEKHTKEMEEAVSKYADYEDLKKKASGYEELNAKLSGYETQIKEKDERIAKYELHSVKQQIAMDAGIPIAMADRLNGTTAEELRKDAEAMSAYIAKDVKVAPLQSESATAPVDAVSAIFKQMNPKLKI